MRWTLGDLASNYVHVETDRREFMRPYVSVYRDGELLCVQFAIGNRLSDPWAALDVGLRRPKPRRESGR